MHIVQFTEDMENDTWLGDHMTWTQKYIEHQIFVNNFQNLILYWILQFSKMKLFKAVDNLLFIIPSMDKSKYWKNHVKMLWNLNMLNSRAESWVGNWICILC